MGPDNRPLDVEWLEDFVALAESGNFSRAAEARAIAQPAFSRAHPIARGVGRRRPRRPRRAPGRADRRAAARSCRSCGRRIASLEAARIKAQARPGRGRGEPALRRHARAVDHVLPALAGGRSRQQLSGPVPDAVRSLACLRGPDDCSGACSSCSAMAMPTCRAGLDEGRLPGGQAGRRRRCVRCGTGGYRAGRSSQHGRRATLPVLDYSDASGLGRILRARLRMRFASRERRRAPGLSSCSPRTTPSCSRRWRSRAAASRGCPSRSSPTNWKQGAWSPPAASTALPDRDPPVPPARRDGGGGGVALGAGGAGLTRAARPSPLRAMPRLALRRWCPAK